MFHKLLFFWVFTLFGLTITAPTANAQVAKPQPIYAVVTKIEGKGSASVRRKSGVTTAVGRGIKTYAGDKITTDSASQVELVLVDGTIVKIGFNSEYRFESAQPQKDFISYVFYLAKGSIRALVEKRQDKKFVKFRLNTPSGTMGVRGTEFLLKHELNSEITSLFLLEGSADFGKLQCEKTRVCIVVQSPQWSFIKKGQGYPSKPEPFVLNDLLGTSGGDPNSKEPQKLDPSLLGLFGINPDSQLASKIEEKDLRALLEKASSDMQRAQDALLGRDEALRKAMDAAKANGTFDQYMKLAEKYDDLKSKKTRNRTGESYSGALSAKKYALASSILKTGKVSLTESKTIIVEKTAPLVMKSTSGSEIKSIDSEIGKDATAAKVEEANKIAQKLGMLATATSTQTAVSMDTVHTDTYYQDYQSKYYTAETLDLQATQSLNESKEISSDYKEYIDTYDYYEKCFFQHCGDFEGEDGYQYVKKTGETTMTETKTVNQTASACYEVRKVCGNVLQPCDLSTGALCKPVLNYQCTEEKKEVTCPN